ncbi:hypothetical protein EVAR_69015_1 [Eumeta japonica]|uniref:Uncharacterized protein n=1 Tax=Eumeta variegata TaxID=151549 RepID=A0A4C2A9H5_EUMVA|nr:hypothetical protein EVAR_69015_1 [Eumeta japonica]
MFRFKVRFTIESDHCNLFKILSINSYKYISWVIWKNNLIAVILHDLQQLLDEQHALVRLFKTALERMPNDYKIVIRADKRPAGSLERAFNAPTIDEVAIRLLVKTWNHAISFFHVAIPDSRNEHMKYIAHIILCDTH